MIYETNMAFIFDTVNPWDLLPSCMMLIHVMGTHVSLEIFELRLSLSIGIERHAND